MRLGCLLDHNGTLNIGDIGISKRIEAKPLIDFQYSSPEVLGVDIKREVLKKADVWSLGVVILELCYFDSKLLNVSLPKDQLQERLNGFFGNLQGKYHLRYMSLLQRILSLNPEERLDIGLIKSELEQNFSEILVSRPL